MSSASKTQLKVSANLDRDWNITVTVKANSGCQLVLENTYMLIRIGVFNDSRSRVEQIEALGCKAGSSLYSLKDDAGNLTLMLPITCLETESVRFVAEYDLDSFLHHNGLESNDYSWLSAEIVEQDMLKIGDEITAETAKTLIGKYGMCSLNVEEIHITDADDEQALGLIHDGDIFLVGLNDGSSLICLNRVSTDRAEQSLSLSLKGLSAEYVNGEWLAYDMKPYKRP